MFKRTALICGLVLGLLGCRSASAEFQWLSFTGTGNGSGRTIPPPAIPYSPVFGALTFHGPTAEISRPDPIFGQPASDGKAYEFAATFELSGSPFGWEIELEIWRFDYMFQRSFGASHYVSSDIQLIEGIDGPVLASEQALASMNLPAQGGYTGPITATIPDGIYTFTGTLVAFAYLQDGFYSRATLFSAEYIVKYQAVPIPEPGSVVLAVLGGLTLIGYRSWRCRRSQG